MANTNSNPRNRAKAGTLTVTGGRREMKGYTVSEDELGSLALLQGGSTLSFAAASALSGFWISVTQNVAFADHVPAAVQSYWEGLATAALIASIAFAALGSFLVVRGYIRVSRIKKGTIHD